MDHNINDDEIVQLLMDEFAENSGSELDENDSDDDETDDLNKMYTNLSPVVPEFYNYVDAFDQSNLEQHNDVMEYNENLAIPLDVEQPNTEAHTWGFESDEEDEDRPMHVPPALDRLPVSHRRQGALPKWRQKNSKPKPHPFTGNQYITNEVNENSTELKCFQLYFPQFIVKLIKKETNRYAFSVIRSLKRRNVIKKNSIWHKWKPLTISEVYKFFSIILHMSLVEKPHIKDYWSTNPVLQTTYASKLMKRDRFISIFSMLHIANNDKYVRKGQPGYDSLYKIRSYVNFLNDKMSKLYYPGQNITVDEGVCPFRGRVHFRVYMKNKPEKYGMKLFIASDPLTGYTLSFEIYSGKGEENNSIIPLYSRLLKQYFNKGHTIYMDRFYTSPMVLEYLWDNKTNGVGTVMANRRGLPKDSVVNAKLKKGEMAFARNGPQICIKWKDTRDVLIMSTCHSADMAPVTVKARGGPIQKFKPVSIIDYNKFKTGVDHGDQMITYYPFKRKTLKWWKKMFFYLFKVSVVNSFIIYKHYAIQNKNPCLKTFMLNLCQQMSEKSGEVIETGTGYETTNVDRLIGRHFIKKIPPTPKKSNPRRTCKVCSKKIKTGKLDRCKKETSYYCPICNVPLCIENCFEVYHTKKQYW
ncbi:piggyBac transposable element-derived protein 4-like [Melanaphis sacchari]|uniref:PiggyBac transposable element-derived protein 4 n=1 Tax=Melanaphis sacchari TaxID=742174 RepID=A0A2H8TXN7_9HEMI|nr:piggyBac transposable element-derived protein 4-like [Melanaphis sacchari]